MKKSNWPSITVITPTYNSGRILERAFSDIRNQDYPQNKIEIIVADGGSKDNTREICRKYKAKFVSVPYNKQNAEYNRGVALSYAKSEYVLILDHDNFLPEKHWLQRMVKPLIDNPEIVASQPCYYHYDKSYTLLDRYFALYGASEPLPIFLNKSDRLRQTSNKWNLPGFSEDKGDYYLVKFENNPRKFLTIGSNGCLERLKILKKYSKIDPDHHFPIDVLVDLLPHGWNKYAFVKTSIIHITGHSGVRKFLWRRLKFVDDYHFKDAQKRRFSVVMPGDEKRVALFVLYSITLIGPLIESFKGYVKIRDVAWFVHPLLCLATTVIYGYTTILHWIKKY